MGLDRVTHRMFIEGVLSPRKVKVASQNNAIPDEYSKDDSYQNMVSHLNTKSVTRIQEQKQEIVANMTPKMNFTPTIIEGQILGGKIGTLM